YAWGVAALAYLYEQLRDASLASTKQMAGYLTLFQSWIYEHFPGLGRRRLVTSYDDTTPRAMRWQSPRQSSTLAEIRSQLDALTYSGVVWHPYEGHRGIRPFFGICMYYGWIRIGDTLWRHFPERVLRQFGFQQDIPRSPTTVPDADVVAIDHMWLHFRAHVVSNVRHAASPLLLQILLGPLVHWILGSWFGLPLIEAQYFDAECSCSLTWTPISRTTPFWRSQVAALGVSCPYFHLHRGSSNSLWRKERKTRAKSEAENERESGPLWLKGVTYQKKMTGEDEKIIGWLEVELARKESDHPIRRLEA
ncbi:hypothetical protein LR48_Vigan09g085000, partial [Vigna angularis]